jgi:hypothetical protein
VRFVAESQQCPDDFARFGPECPLENLSRCWSALLKPGAVPWYHETVSVQMCFVG